MTETAQETAPETKTKAKAAAPDPVYIAKCTIISGGQQYLPGQTVPKPEQLERLLELDAIEAQA